MTAVGYVSACSVKNFDVHQQYRFTRLEIESVFDCPISNGFEPEDPLHWIYPDPDYQPWYYAGGPAP
jgi:hypothetical protein